MLQTLLIVVPHLVSFANAAPLRRTLAEVPEGPWAVHTVSLPGRGDAGAALNVRYLEAGRADDPVILLLHGFPDTAYGWRSIVPLLATDHRVLAPDLRGYGGTDVTQRGYDLATLVDDARAFVATVASPGPVHVVGHDWGALILWTWAQTHPAELATATVLTIPHARALRRQWDEDPAQRRYRGFVRTLLLPGAAGFLAGMSEPARAKSFFLRELVDDSALTASASAHYHAAFDERIETRAALQYYASNFQPFRRLWEIAEAAAPSAVPTLVLFGEDDNYMRAAMAEKSCEHVTARCAAQVFPGAGHYLHWEKAAEVAQAWRGFVE